MLKTIELTTSPFLVFIGILKNLGLTSIFVLIISYQYFSIPFGIITLLLMTSIFLILLRTNLELDDDYVSVKNNKIPLKSIAHCGNLLGVCYFTHNYKKPLIGITLFYQRLTPININGINHSALDLLKHRIKVHKKL